MLDDKPDLEALLASDPIYAEEHEAAAVEYQLVQTCSACPEQYDVMRGDVRIAYMRVRNHGFSVECGTDMVYQVGVDGDGLFTEAERPYHLSRALVAIRQRDIAMQQMIAAMDDSKPFGM